MNNQKLITEQEAICRKYAASPYIADLAKKVGISRSALDGELPLNGLRHPPESGTTGWFIWGGESLSQDADFFLPLHARHLESRCPHCLKFLSLPPGWRFLTDGEYDDVWFDETLL